MPTHLLLLRHVLGILLQLQWLILVAFLPRSQQGTVGRPGDQHLQQQVHV
jgi:hypothetical protein